MLILENWVYGKFLPSYFLDFSENKKSDSTFFGKYM